VAIVKFPIQMIAVEWSGYRKLRQGLRRALEMRRKIAQEGWLDLPRFGRHLG